MEAQHQLNTHRIDDHSHLIHLLYEVIDQMFDLLKKVALLEQRQLARLPSVRLLIVFVLEDQLKELETILVYLQGNYLPLGPQTSLGGG